MKQVAKRALRIDSLELSLSSDAISVYIESYGLGQGVRIAQLVQQWATAGRSWSGTWQVKGIFLFSTESR
jgi:hypothetical protein